MKRVALFIVFGIAFYFVNAQNSGLDSIQIDSLIIDSISECAVKPVLPPGEVVYHVDSFYFATSALQKKINQVNCPNLVDGYRVQIFSCSGQGCQEKVNKQYNQFLIAYPDVPVYKIWQSPTIKVRVGDCRTRFLAEKIKNDIRSTYQHVFVVPDYINSPYQLDCEDMKISKSDSLLYLPLRK